MAQLGILREGALTENQSSDVMLLKSVMDGLKPIGFVSLTDYAETDFVSEAVKSMLEYKIAQGNQFQRRVLSLSDQKLSDYLAGFDYANPEDNYELILTGLILGFPIESTFACIIGSVS